MFNNVKKLSWPEKTFAESIVTVRKTELEEIQRRSTSTEFYLKNNNGANFQVSKMFLNTLSVGEIAVKK